jgi:methyl-accepting chemotaxis protein
MLNLAVIQPIIEHTIQTLEEVAAASVYSGNGFIMASYRPDRIGKMMIDEEVQFGDYAVAANAAIQAGKEFECYSYAPMLGTNLQIAVSSFTIGNSDTTWSLMIGSTE